MNYAVILASGTGSRLGSDIPKQYIKINNKTILEHTLQAFDKNEMTDRIILVVHPDYLEFANKIELNKLYKVVAGGATRQESSYNGISAIKEDDSKVLIHDACRPFIKNELINRCYRALDKYNAIDVGIETSDTIVQVDCDNFISKTMERNTLRRCQTPQGFKTSLIKRAHNFARENSLSVTDDVGLVFALGEDRVYVVNGDIDNIKITYKDDITLAKERL